MNAYTASETLHALWEKGLAAYKNGETKSTTGWYTSADLANIAALGLSVVELYDYVDDYVRYKGDPGFASVAAVSEIRRQYFYQVQKGIFSTQKVDAETLPPKTEAVDGIAWLPRILVKARGKLKGELPSSIMYGCAGDRSFLKENNLHPAELLHQVWHHSNEDVIEWVKAQQAIGALASEGTSVNEASENTQGAACEIGGGGKC